MLGGEAQLPAQPLGQASTEDHHHDWEAEREAIRLEYERKMAELRQQYDQWVGNYVHKTWLSN